MTGPRPTTSTTAAASTSSASAGRAIAFGAVAAAVSAAIWALLRAYTGIFDILNLRVFVGAVILAVPIGTVMFLAKENKRPAILFAQSLFAVAVVLGGEFLGAALGGRDAVWDRFSLLFLAIGAALPWLYAKKLV